MGLLNSQNSAHGLLAIADGVGPEQVAAATRSRINVRGSHVRTSAGKFALANLTQSAPAHLGLLALFAAGEK